MIGRFAIPGVYKDLFNLREFYICALGGGLALMGFLWDWAGLAPAWISLVMALAAVAINGLPIVREAIQGIWERQVNVDELVSLAIIASCLQGEFLTAAVVSFIMTLGSLVEEAVSASARKSIQALVRIAPEQATLLADGVERVVPVAGITTGDVLLVKPGERMPVDGEIIAGRTAVDESSITGEALPRERGIGDQVLAGTLNYNGVIEIKAVKVGEDTTLGKVIKLVTEAENHKPSAARLVDRYATWFTPTVLALAGLAWAWSGDVSRAVAVLIAGCPCALIMAAPTATVAAIGRAAKAGILIKGGQFLEEAARADVVLFDKTGTLTLGEPKVDDVVAGNGLETREVIAWAACAEQNCAHPLARAVVKAAHYARVTVRRAESILSEIGLGVRAMVDGDCIEVGSAHLGGGNAALPSPFKAHLEAMEARGATPIVVYRNKEPIGLLSVSDKPRPTAQATIQALKQLGIKSTGILSGDHERSVRKVAESLGVDKHWAGLKPQDKLEVIERLQTQEGRRIIFVGDGVNDAPALARANVGIAMGAAGTDVALETADIALTHDDISKLPFLIKLSRRTVAMIKINIGLGLLFNAVAIFGSGYGLLSPIMASLFHNFGSVIVVLSSASLAFLSEGRLAPKAVNACP
ncbi:copper/silver-translocating P-type ATPase [Desulfocurvibacter africanus PCS]|uniref:P-type Zn(2+) transporter n=1 Tax=Desulfocurvibacter africanus PCS TaxID=1262666 RepID=M5PWI8_DESAF|nr:cation-translocating P-type ATPase [Desulfocurvibacter africanus]EMG38350.1 copper/silver-translocating P-type ATPase [Desulfocurvibacter africanus PCS]